MITRRRLLGAATLLPFFKSRNAVQDTLPDDFGRRCIFVSDSVADKTGGEITVRSPMTVDTIDGYVFAFDWHLEPGDVVHTSYDAGINGVFVYVVKPNRVMFAWSFHKHPLSSYAVLNAEITAEHLKDFSLRNGHDLRVTYGRYV